MVLKSRGTEAHPHAKRRSAEAEFFSEFALQIAHIGGRELAIHEQQEGGRVGGALGGVEHSRPAGRAVGGLGFADGLVDETGGDALAIVFHHSAEGWEYLVGASSGECRYGKYRAVAHEAQPPLHFFSHLGSLFGVEQLPFVEQQKHRAAGVVHPLGQTEILVGDACGGVYDEQHDVGLVYGAQGSQGCVSLGFLVYAGFAAQTCGVHEADGA